MAGMKVDSALLSIMETVAAASAQLPQRAEETDKGFSDIMDKAAKQVDVVSELTPARAPAPVQADERPVSNKDTDGSKPLARDKKESRTEDRFAVEEAGQAETGDTAAAKEIAQRAGEGGQEASSEEEGVPVKLQNIAAQPVDFSDKPENQGQISQQAEIIEVVEIPDEVKEIVADAIAEVVDNLTDILDVTQQQVEMAIDSLELLPTDLLDTETIQPLAVEIVADGDAMSIITDENLFEAVGQLEDLVDMTRADLADELELDEKGLKDLLGQLKNEAENTGLAEETKPVETALSEERLVYQAAAKPVEDNAQSNPDHIMEGSNQEVTLTDSRAPITYEGQEAAIDLEREQQVENPLETLPAQEEEPTYSPLGEIREERLENPAARQITTQAQADRTRPQEGAEPIAQRAEEDSTRTSGPLQQIEDSEGDKGQETGSQQRDSRDFKKAPSQAGTAGQTLVRSTEGLAQSIRAFADDLQQGIREAAPQGMSNSYVSDNVQALDLLRQISTAIRQEAMPGMTELTMHLNPESLGSLHIRLISNEGVLTARFIAESEAVKQALTTQVAELRENLENQGMKVEAVEVTVAEQGFNRSYSENEQNQSRYEEPDKKQPRAIRLSGDTSPEDVAAMDLDEGDRLAAEMMALNGNVLDYLV